MGKRSNDRGKENQLFRLSHGARKIDLDLVRGSPYRSAAPQVPHQRPHRSVHSIPHPEGQILLALRAATTEPERVLGLAHTTRLAAGAAICHPFDKTGRVNIVGTVVVFYPEAGACSLKYCAAAKPAASAPCTCDILSGCSCLPQSLFHGTRPLLMCYEIIAVSCRLLAQ